MKKGKDKCEILKKIRKYVAKKYGLDYKPTECNHEGDCKGTCPKCEAELADLQEQLEAKGITDIASDKKLNALIKQYAEESQEDISDSSDSDIEAMHMIGMPDIEGMEYFISDEQNANNAPWGEMLLECRIAGTSHHHVDDILDQINEGDEVFLVRDFQNKHDGRAVAVTLVNPYLNKLRDFDFSNILGYIPKKENEAVATILDMGWQNILAAKITEIHPDSDYEKLRIKVYVRQKDKLMAEEEEQAKSSLRAVNMSDCETSELEQDLCTKGFAHFHWGGYPLECHNLPEKGQRVVFFNHETGGGFKLYLMMLVATGLECEPFLEDKDELHTVDDCYPFMFTNIKGPIFVEEDDMDAYIKSHEDDFIGQAEQPLPSKSCTKLFEFFNIDTDLLQ